MFCDGGVRQEYKSPTRYLLKAAFRLWARVLCDTVTKYRRGIRSSVSHIKQLRRNDLASLFDQFLVSFKPRLLTHCEAQPHQPHHPKETRIMDHIHKDTFCLTSLIAIHLTVVSMIALVCLSNARIALQAKHSYNYRIRHACTTSDIRPDHQGRGQHRSIHVADHFSNASQQGCNTHLKFLEKMPLHHRHQRVLRISHRLDIRMGHSLELMVLQLQFWADIDICPLVFCAITVLGC